MALNAQSTVVATQTRREQEGGSSASLLTRIQSMQRGAKGASCHDELVVALYKDDQTEVLLFITMSKVYLDCVMT